MDFIQIPFGYVLEFFYNFFNNYGIALILFSLAVKLVLFPMSAKSKKSMMKTSRLQPKIKQIELACGDDKQKYQQEVQQLYKDEGVSMFGGCLWSLLPLFILFPLYTVIREPLEYILHLTSEQIDALKNLPAVADFDQNYWQYGVASHIEELGIGIVEGVKNLNLSFLGVDLGQTPDWQIWKMSSWSEIGGALFPLVSGGLNYLSMFISQKMNNTVIRDEKGEKDEAAARSAQTGKTMNLIMPLISIWFGFIMPLGISVYWIAQSVFGIIQDVILTKHYRKVYDAEDAVKRERAAERAAEEAERERIRAAKRAANPNGIKENTSKKKQQLREKQERDAAAKDYEIKQGNAPAEVHEDVNPGAEPNRPYARGRAYSGDHYGKHED
ncbi:MAG: YidC/Oxa1 family membrane protein insertase [Ruminococcaceae bacterium]|nr:YidC/Oxa1 family membrane protein insertase [Oscillospiraceae bacterium]